MEAAYVPLIMRGCIAAGQPKPGDPVGILRGPEDWATLINLRGIGQPSEETRKTIDDFLKQRTSRALIDLKRWLGIGRGRPRNLARREVWVVGAALRKENPSKYSWSVLTRQLDPKGYAEDRHGVTDRMRLGITAVGRSLLDKVERST